MEDTTIYAALRRRLRHIPNWNMETVEDAEGVTLWAVSGEVRTEFCRVLFLRTGTERLDLQQQIEAARRDANTVAGMWSDIGLLLEKAYEPSQTERLERSARQADERADRLEKENQALRGLRGARRSLLSAYKSIRVAVEKSGGFED